MSVVEPKNDQPALSPSKSRIVALALVKAAEELESLRAFSPTGVFVRQCTGELVGSGELVSLVRITQPNDPFWVMIDPTNGQSLSVSLRASASLYPNGLSPWDSMEKIPVQWEVPRISNDRAKKTLAADIEHQSYLLACLRSVLNDLRNAREAKKKVDQLNAALNEMEHEFIELGGFLAAPIDIEEDELVKEDDRMTESA